jgi:hypothetical protein
LQIGHVVQLSDDDSCRYGRPLHLRLEFNLPRVTLRVSRNSGASELMSLPSDMPLGVPLQLICAHVRRSGERDSYYW